MRTFCVRFTVSLLSSALSEATRVEPKASHKEVTSMHPASLTHGGVSCVRLNFVGSSKWPVYLRLNYGGFSKWLLVKFAS